MGLIFWVDEDKFVADLVGKVFQKKGLDFYHLESVEEFSFRVLDLRPEMIVVDGKTLERNRAHFESVFSQNKELGEYSYVLKGEGEVSVLPNVRGVLSMPLDPFQVPGLIERMK